MKRVAPDADKLCLCFQMRQGRRGGSPDSDNMRSVSFGAELDRPDGDAEVDGWSEVSGVSFLQVHVSFLILFDTLFPCSYSYMQKSPLQKSSLATSLWIQESAFFCPHPSPSITYTHPLLVTGNIYTNL